MHRDRALLLVGLFDIERRAIDIQLCGRWKRGAIENDVGLTIMQEDLPSVGHYSVARTDEFCCFRTYFDWPSY